MIWIVYMAVWISMAAAVSVGIVVTGKWSLLWFMLIPALVEMRSDGTRSRRKEGKRDEQDKD